MFSLKDKVIVVTGGTGILGHAFINAIAKAGGIVGVMGRNEKIANERVEKIIANGGEAIALITDVLDSSQVEDAKTKLLNKYSRIDGLVNAAGGNVPESVVQNDANIFSLNMDAMKKAMDLNLWGTMIPTQIFGDALSKGDKASIVTISSVSSKQVLTKVLGYSMGKAAIDTYTKWFAVELANRYGDKIRMNALTPGFFLTEQNRTLLTNSDGSLTQRGQLIIQNTPFKRFGSPEELCGALVWLLSDASTFVTGSEIIVDGGFTVFSGV
jgi:NAD(P)-dependent dehydrogenase (short-subunit alcohol dehydrogenase family)